jgi:hypothetical protein
MSLKVVVTIDVEEEGLFRGRYHSHGSSVNNVSELTKLDSIFREWGVRPTLLVTYPVAAHERHQHFLMNLRDKWHGEIGAHLHWWNTPPLEKLPYPEPIPSRLIPRELLQAKISKLFGVLKSMGASPTSFRMGRFNMSPGLFSVLKDTGITVDSSIAPMHRYLGGPDHLCAPIDPYFPDPDDPRRQGASKLLEVPITNVPIVGGLGHFLERLPESLIPRDWVSWFAMYLGSLSVQPMGTGLRRMKAAACLHRARGGRVLTIFFHSSELMPGANPQHSTDHQVGRFLKRLRDFFAWLHSQQAEFLTLSEIRFLYGEDGCIKGGAI